jgi:hypothetical protein
MTSQSLRNDAEHWRTRAEEVRMLASEEKDTTTKDALLRTADDYERLAHWVEDWALRYKEPKNLGGHTWASRQL